MDVTTNPSRRPAFRKLAAAAGALFAVSLAGCSDANTDSASGADDGTDRDPLVATTAGPGTRAANADGGDPTDQNGEPVDVTCDEEALASLEDERYALEEQLLELEPRVNALRTGERATEYLLGQIESGFSGRTIEQGRTVGIAARSSVVVLQIVEGGTPTNHATAWFVDDGYLFTNAHNVYPSGPDTEFQGVTQDGDRFDVEVVDLFEEMFPDVALLRTGYRGSDPLPLTAVDELEPGQPLVQVGHPGEIGFWIISMGRFIEDRPEWTFDQEPFTALKSVVPGRPGVSGSPVLTLDGAVVGMTNGGQAVANREIGAPAPVAPDIVFDGPIGDVAISLHDGSDILERKLEEWR